MPGKVRKASMVKTIIPGTISRSPFLISNPVYLSGWIARSYHLTILLSLEEPLPLYFFAKAQIIYQITVYPNYVDLNSTCISLSKISKGIFLPKPLPSSQVTIFLASSSAKIVPQRRQGRGASDGGLWLLRMWGSNHLNHWVLVVLIGIQDRYNLAKSNNISPT